nr:MAG TPA: hypothetical protein [Caudoviricetes sp.]
MLRSAEFSASINSNAGNPFNRFGQHENSALRFTPWGFCISGGEENAHLGG